MGLCPLRSTQRAALRAYAIPSSFTTKEVLRLKGVPLGMACHKEPISSTSSDTLRERLHLGFNLINYLTYKIFLV